MVEVLQALDVAQLETAQIETRPVRFAEGDVVALKHNCMETLFRALFLAILRKDHHRSNNNNNNNLYTGSSLHKE